MKTKFHSEKPSNVYLPRYAGGKSHYRNVIFFKKLRFQNVFCLQSKADVFKFLWFEERFRDGLVWMVGQISNSSGASDDNYLKCFSRPSVSGVIISIFPRLKINLPHLSLILENFFPLRATTLAKKRKITCIGFLKSLGGDNFTVINNLRGENAPSINSAW